MTTQVQQTPYPSTDGGAAGSWLTRHPMAGYVVLTYAWSWTLWAGAWLVGGPVRLLLVVAGGFGPPLAAATMLRARGRPIGPWARAILRWKVPIRFYCYALLLPVVLYLAVDVALVIGGNDIAWDELPHQVPAYLASFLLTLTLFGGMEEPGWRGYALPLLERTHHPAKATLLLGLVWGVWHVPLYGPAGFVVPLVLAFFYTWPYNRTGSVLVCIVLHAGMTAAQDNLILTADSLAVDLGILGAYLLGALAVVVLTRGRLGLAVRR